MGIIKNVVQTENLAAAFAASARRHPEKDALFWGDEGLRYLDLDAQSSFWAERLSGEFGIQPGDRVGVLLRNCPEFISALLAILRLGAVVVPINNFLKADEVAYIVADAEIKVLLTERALADHQDELPRRIPGLRLPDLMAWPKVAEPGHPSRFQSPAISGEDLAVIIYTSGTTGRPKGAMLTHHNLLHNVESCRQMLEAVDFDRFVLALPMFHSFMLCVCVFLPLIVGGSIVLVKSVHPPRSLMQEIVQHRATICPGIPQLFRALAHLPLEGQIPLRLCISGAAPLPVEVQREFNARFPVPLIEGYGLSEASPVVSLNPIRGPWKMGSIGVPIPGVEVTVQDETGNVLPDGEIGEICVRGGNVMKGYWRQPEETAKAFRHGWLLTGDVGYRDADGYFAITDRKKDMLLVNGNNVYPREIEEVLYHHQSVKEAAVVGLPDARKGEQPVAFVVLKEGQSPNDRDLVSFLRAHLADYKVPRHVRFLDSLPRNATGKVLKTALRELEHKAQPHS
jgi:long-chain acyl-CoA synthetase